MHTGARPGVRSGERTGGSEREVEAVMEGIVAGGSPSAVQAHSQVQSAWGGGDAEAASKVDGGVRESWVGATWMGGYVKRGARWMGG